MLDMDSVLSAIGADDWESDGDVLVCPCGWTIEMDGRCPDGCVSPLREMGLI